MNTPIVLTEILRKPQQEIEEITLDGTSYIIQISTLERNMVIYPDRDVDHGLVNTAGALLRVISGCSNGVPGEIEEHQR